jgi:hypothetical protein
MNQIPRRITGYYLNVRESQHLKEEVKGAHDSSQEEESKEDVSQQSIEDENLAKVSDIKGECSDLNMHQLKNLIGEEFPCEIQKEIANQELELNFGALNLDQDSISKNVLPIKHDYLFILQYH